MKYDEDYDEAEDEKTHEEKDVEDYESDLDYLWRNPL